MIAKFIPHMFTLGNLVLGIVALILAFHQEVVTAAFLVILAMLADGLDGRIARALNVQSEFGKELDSLSDVISFGVAPAFIAFVTAFSDFGTAGWVAAILFPVCGALRLARFNVTSGTHNSFIGLPIPAAGGILCTLSLFWPDLDAVMILIACFALSFLMISNVRYPSFKQLSAIPKVYLWVTPLIIVASISVAVIYPWMTKFIMLPLVLYALWGLKKNVNLLFIRRLRIRRHRRRHEDQTVNSDITS